MVYFFYSQFPQYPLYFLVRSNEPVEQVAASMRKVIWDSDPGAVIARIKSLDAQVKDSLSSERFQTKLLVAFGIIALFLAALGIYGVLSYSVATRKQEIGIRMALGATRERINGAVLSEAAVPVLVGLLTGCLASVAISRTLEALLYSAKSIDGSVTAAALVLLLGVAGLAAFFPAYRAASISPADALRQE
jgi:ABC-type antimicrobial peptide transport system permease subunit